LRLTLRRGTPLWRVHHAPYGAWGFKAKPLDVLYGGARFDATEADAYPYLYAGLSGGGEVAVEDDEPLVSAGELVSPQGR
jgi:hypothetical protein